MVERPIHHGNLRSVLLEDAIAVLRESGAGGLSLRDLARRAGVSRGAPRSHFLDRQALLDALAELGFDRLTAAIDQALTGPGVLPERFARVARAYVDFAIDDAALMELMFDARATDRSGRVEAAAGALFAVLDGALGASPEHARDQNARDLFKMLFAATMQGIAALVASRRINRTDGDRLVDAATAMMLGSELGARTVTSHSG